MCLPGFDWPGRTERAIAAYAEAGELNERRDKLRLIGGMEGAAAEQLLAQAAGDPTPELRAEALHAIGKRGAAALASILVQALADADAGVRAAAADGLGALGEKAATTPLVRGLGDSDTGVRIAVARALGTLGDPSALSALATALDDPATEVRVEVAHSLGEIGDPAALAPLLGKIRDPAPELRLAVIDALAALGSGRAAGALLAALDDPNEEVVLDALRALSALGPGVEPAPEIARRVGQLASSADARVQSGAEVALARLGAARPAVELEAAEHEAAPRWLAVLERSAAPQLEHPEALLDVLERELPAGEALATDPLVLWLSRAEPALRPRIARLIARAQPSSGRGLVSLLDDPDPRVRSAIAEALGHVDDASLAPPLARHLGDADAATRRAAALALGAVADPGTLVALGGQIERGSLATRRAAALALTQGLARRAAALDAAARDALLGSLEAALRQKDGQLAALGARGLGFFPVPRALAALAGVAAERPLGVRIAALRATTAFHSEDARALRRGAASERDAGIAATALAAQVLAGDPLDPAQLVLLLRASPWPRGPVAAFALARHAEAETLGRELCRALDTREPLSRANLVAALARMPRVECLDEPGLRWLLGAAAWPVRFAAARWAHARAGATADARFQRALSRCAERESNALVRAACARSPITVSSAPSPVAAAYRALVSDDGSVLISAPDASLDPSWPELDARASENPWQWPYARE